MTHLLMEKEAQIQYLQRMVQEESGGSRVLVQRGGGTVREEERTIRDQRMTPAGPWRSSSVTSRQCRHSMKRIRYQWKLRGAKAYINSDQANRIESGGPKEGKPAATGMEVQWRLRSQTQRQHSLGTLLDVSDFKASLPKPADWTAAAPNSHSA